MLINKQFRDRLTAELNYALNELEVVGHEMPMEDSIKIDKAIGQLEDTIRSLENIEFKEY